MGISLIYHKSPRSNCFGDLHNSLYNINHTGQESCGIVISDGSSMFRDNHDGLVRSFKPIVEPEGYYGIGNVNSYGEHQPRIFSKKGLGKFALTFDGYIVNEDELRRITGESYSTPYQMEIAAKLIARGNDFPEGIEILAKEMVGPYCIGIITDNGEAFIARDPFGIRSLIFGNNKKGYGSVTESRALEHIGMEIQRDVKPGEIINVDRSGFHPVKEVEGRFGKGRKHCSFLWGYYSWIDSVIENIAVNDVRERCGAKLAEYDKGMEIDVVTGVPDSGKAYADGYSKAAGLHNSEVITKYAYSYRSYTRPTQEERQMEADSKQSIVKSRAKGKRIMVLDDSLRRGTQSRRLIKRLRECGPKEIHLRFGTPRNTAYCRFDKRDKGDETLIANRLKTDTEIAKYIGADSVKFIEIDDFYDALTKGSELSRDDFCGGCYTRDFRFSGIDL